LAVYSAALLALEWQTSQDHVRHYFTDIKGPVFFYAVNTSLSASLLAGAGLLFLFTALHALKERRQQLLFAGQGLFCLWSAFDDRFSIHEKVAGALETGDGYLMASVALANAALYLALFRPTDFNRTMAVRLTLAAGFYFVMLLFDTSMPDRMLWRLSIEDLCKTWAGLMFLALAWETLRFHALGRARGEEPLVLPSWIARFAPRWWGTA
jgi:hypothetical protein